MEVSWKSSCMILTMQCLSLAFAIGWLYLLFWLLPGLFVCLFVLFFPILLVVAFWHKEDFLFSFKYRFKVKTKPMLVVILHTLVIILSCWLSFCQFRDEKTKVVKDCMACKLAVSHGTRTQFNDQQWRILRPFAVTNEKKVSITVYGDENRTIWILSRKEQ